VASVVWYDERQGRGGRRGWSLGQNKTDREGRRREKGKRVGPIRSVTTGSLTTRQTRMERSDPRAVVRSIDPESARRRRRRRRLSLSSEGCRQVQTQARGEFGKLRPAEGHRDKM
jgi:hypothetical protein